MAINLLTGLPGNGKTLYTVSYVDAWAKRENRPVFYYGIKDLTLDWTLLDDPEKWFECPPNSIVVIDECQEIFRPRTAGKTPPMHVSELETHRHKGIDLWLMTQHPTLADTALRRLTQRHMHIVRIWGMQAATIHEWQGAQIDCEKESARVKSQKTKWAFDKKAYAHYKSAETHTVSRAIPKRVVMLCVLPFILVGLGYVAYAKLMHKPVVPVAAGAAVASSPGVSSAVGSVNKPPVFDPIADAKQYANLHTERVVGLPHTAPIYDEIRKPTEAPLPAACVEFKKRCTCYTQQGTKMTVELNMCLQIVHNGFFDDSPKKPEMQNAAYSGNAPSAARSYAPAFASAAAVPVSQIAQAAPPSAGGRDGFGALGKSGKWIERE